MIVAPFLIGLQNIGLAVSYLLRDTLQITLSQRHTQEPLMVYAMAETMQEQKARSIALITANP